MYMALNDLTELDIYRAIFTSIFVIISLIVGFKIILKYFKFKNKELITIGLGWIFISSAWWPLPISFVSIICFNYLLDPPFYLFFMRAFVPLAIACWIYSFSVLTYPQYKKKIYVPYTLICVIYEAILLILLIIDYNYIAIYDGGFSYRHTLFSSIFLYFVIASFVLSGVIFGKKSLKSKTPSIRWKGRFFILAILTFTIGAFLEIFSTGLLVFQIIIRLILVLSAIEYYFGFFLPERLFNILIRNQG